MKNIKKHITFFIILILGIIGSYYTYKINTDYSTDTARIHFIENYGWQVEKKPYLHEKIKIPVVFEFAEKEYNEIQKRAGFDLEHYKGAVCDRYSYRLLNHPEDKKYAYINIFVYQKNIIAADVVSPKIDGNIRAINDKEWV